MDKQGKVINDYLSSDDFTYEDELTLAEHYFIKKYFNERDYASLSSFIEDSVLFRRQQIVEFREKLLKQEKEN